MSRVSYSNVIGCMMYAMIATRSDIGYGIGLVSRFMSCPSRDHWQAVKWLLRNLNGSSKLGLVYGKAESDQVEIKGFCDTDLDKRRSLTGFVFTLGGNVVSGSLSCNILWHYLQRRLSMWL